MKKLFALLLAVMLIFSLAACGNNDDNPSGSENNPGTSQSGENNDGGIDRSTASAFFASYGLSEADIKPAGVGEGEIKINEYIDSQAEVTYKAELSFEKAIEWRDMLMNATKAASEDGKIYANVSSGKEYTTPEWIDTASKSCTATWSYKYNGDVVIVSIDTTYDGVDEPYFSIELELV